MLPVSNKHHILISLVILSRIVSYGHSELITTAVLASVPALIALNWDSVKENTVCRFTECCTSSYIPYDLEKLESTLSSNLFGQPLVFQLVNILNAQKESQNQSSEKVKRNNKALVISLHGWSGVGKNYATTMVAEALYKKGMHSKYVKTFMGSKDFDCNDVDNSKAKLIKDVQEVVRKCPNSLIIFDEIHDMCPSILDAIKPMFDHHQSVDGVDYRNTIFIFISNIGSAKIASILTDLYGQGLKREDVKFEHFEPHIRKTAFYIGGFKHSATISNHLIDHYIPFLPLEMKHVEMCARNKFRENGINDPTEEMMSEAMTVVSYNEDQPTFANNGCKRFTRQVPYIVQKFAKTVKP